MHGASGIMGLPHPTLRSARSEEIVVTSDIPPPPPPGDGSQPATSYPSYPSYGGPGQPTGAGAGAGGEAIPGYPQGGTPPQALIEQPQSISLAVLLMRIGAGLSVVNVLVGLLTRSSLRSNIEDSLRTSGKLTQSNLDTAYHVALASIVFIGILGVALWLWMAHTNGNGRKWARVVATALGGLGTLGFVLSLAQGEATALSLTLSALTALLAVAIIVLIWRKESSRFYESRSRRTYP